MEYCFVEKWPSDYSLPPGVEVVALTPNASYQLDKAGISYRTFKDFFATEEIRKDADSFLDEQIIWLKDFDNLLFDIFPEAKSMNVQLASLYFHNIKLLADFVVLSSRIIVKFIETVKPSKVWFMPEIYGADKIIRWTWFAHGESSLFRITPLICSKYGVAFEELKTGKDFCQPQRSEGGNGFSLLKNLLILKFSLIKRDILRYKCLLARRGRKKENVFVIREFAYTKDFYLDATRAGYNIFYKENDNIYSLSLLPFSKKIAIKYIQPEKKSALESSVSPTILSRIMEWVNVKCGVDVSGVLASRLNFMIKEVFPETIERIRQYRSFYDKYKINFVISYANSTVDDFAAVAAARVSRMVKCVSFFHGTDAFKFKMRYFSEYYNYDYLFASTSEEVQYVRNLIELCCSREIKVYEYSYFRDQFPKFRRTGLRILIKQEKPLIIYVPIIREERMNMPILKGQLLQWDYFDWHKALIDYFSVKRNYRFVWKSLPQRFDRGDTIEDIIKERSIKNVEFSSGLLAKWFKKADKVICDVPSTAFFESVFAGLPTMAFYAPGQELRENAFGEYKKSLQPYLSMEQGLNSIDEFLKSDSQEYIVTQSAKKVFVPDFLNYETNN